MAELTDPLTRRSFIRRSSFVVGGALAAGGLLGACGGDDGETEASGTTASGSSSSGDGDSKTGTNLHSYDAKNNDFWISWEKGAREACAALGMEYTEAISEYDVAKQRGFFENAGTKNVDTCSMIATDEGGSASLVKTLTDQGILVVNFNSNAPWSTPLDVDDKYIQYLSVSNYFGANAMAKSLIEEMGGKGKLVHLQGVVGLSHDTERTIGLDDALKEFPDVELVARQPGEYNRTDGQRVFEDILAREGDVDAVFCQNDDMAIGVLNALKQAGKTALVAGVDGVAEWLDLIESDDMAYGTWAFHPRYGSALEVVRLFDALNGWTPEVPERFMGYGSVIIDTAEAATKYKEIVFADESPWDYAKMSRTLHPDDWDMQLPAFAWRPEVFWAAREKEKPSGYELPSEYEDADFDGTNAMYEEHFSTDTLADVVKLTNFGKYIVAD